MAKKTDEILAAMEKWFQRLGVDTQYWNARFDRFARVASRLAGRPVAFNVAIFIILVWMLSGPVFGFSDTWQLIINTATTIVTFLMVFIIQHTQNRDTDAIQIKLDELIRAVDSAENMLLDLEEMEEEELEILRQRYLELAQKARQELRERASRKEK